MELLRATEADWSEFEEKVVSSEEERDEERELLEGAFEMSGVVDKGEGGSGLVSMPGLVVDMVDVVGLVLR